VLKPRRLDVVRVDRMERRVALAHRMMPRHAVVMRLLVVLRRARHRRVACTVRLDGDGQVKPRLAP
jgi:hypothetical protein